VAKTPIVYFEPMFNQWMLIPQFRMQFEGQLAIIE
jgi:small GTP-binding protein